MKVGSADVLENYIHRFANLRTDVSKTRWSAATCHRAPHKPLLLLAMMDLFAEGCIRKNLIEITPDLGELFTLYWARVMPPDRQGNLHLPFFHLWREKQTFWHLVPQSNKQTILEATHQVKSLNQLRELIVGARLDIELYQLLCIEASRNALRAILIETYFAPQARSGLIEQGIINAEAWEYSEKLLEQVRSKKSVEGSEPAKPSARDQGFRRAVVSSYSHQCAFCGIRVMTADGHTVVDAAHIIPWSITHNDDPRNGLALCKLCHWTFDEGLLSVSQKYVLIVSPTTKYSP